MIVKIPVLEVREPTEHIVSMPKHIARIANGMIGCAQELVIVMTTDTQLRVIGTNLCHMGGLDQCTVDPRVLFRHAIADGATGLAVVHNHPSGNLKPSTSDMALAKKLDQGAKLLNLTLVDFLITTDLAGGGIDWLSFKTEGLI